MTTRNNPLVIDISHHNTVGGSGPALAGFKRAYAAGVRGVIHKATQGSSYVDPMYAKRREAATKAGLLWGAYHFADNSSVDAQVENFLRNASGLLVLDWEQNGTRTMSKSQAKTFIDKVATITGQFPAIYTGYSFITEMLGTRPDPVFSQCRLWVARYSAKVGKVQASWDKPWLWQWTDKGTVDGISKPVDCNHYAGTEDDLAREWV